MKEIDFKFVIKLIIVMFLITPIFFGFNIEYLLPRKIDLLIFSILIVGIIIISVLSYMTVQYQISEKMFDKIKSHEIINAFINSEFFPLYSSFLITMIMEELIFRFYIVGLLIYFIKEIYAVLISSAFFSIFHLHTWFSHRDKGITVIYLIYSLLLGLLLAYVFLNLGIVISIFIHYCLALTFYYEIYRKFKIKDSQNIMEST